MTIILNAQNCGCRSPGTLTISGSAAPGSRVDLHQAGVGNAWGSAMTDSSGNFSVTSIPLPPGNWNAAVRELLQGGAFSDWTTLNNIHVS